MGKGYSAQNIASFLIYELTEKSYKPTKMQLQQLLRIVDLNWMSIFGHSAFHEKKHSNENYYIYEVYQTYEEQFQSDYITEPAREWFLPYGQFQLIYRPFAVPAFSPLEKIVMQKIIQKFFSSVLLKVS